MSSDDQQPIWIAGCGDIGRRLASRYLAQRLSVKGLVRSAASLLACEQLGIAPILADFSQPLAFDIDQLRSARLFYFVPPQPAGREDTSLVNFLAHIGAAPRRIVLISTTAVYGDCQGAWIDESSPVRPTADRAYRRLDAELELRNWANHHRKEYVILRVPGIYALDRLPLSRIKKGLPVIRQEQSPFTNRIHADDLAKVCEIAMDQAKSGEVFNVTDGCPCTMTEYFDRVADFAGLPRPPQISFEEAQRVMSAGMLSYLKESRRIDNQKLLRQLGVTLDFPSLQDALQTKPKN